MLSASSADRLRHWLQSLVDVRPGEGARVALLFVYSMAASGGVLTIGQAASDVLFMSEMPSTALPYMFILPAAAIIPVLLLYNQAAARLPLTQAVIGSNLLLLAGVVLFRLLLDTSLATSFALLAALYMFMEFAGTLLILQFWNVAGQAFNTREAKRLFGLIAAGGTLAMPVAGLSLVALVRLIGVGNLLWIVVLSILICIACVTALGRWQRSALVAQAAPPTPTHDPPKLGTILHSPLLRTIGGITIVLSLLINIGTYQFYQALQLRFDAREADMAVYLGAFEFWAGVAAVVVQVALTGRIIHRFGIFVALLLFPLAMALGAGLSIALGGVLWTITLIRAADPIFQATINTAALNVLYLPFSGHIRERAKELFEGWFAASFGIAGAIFLLAQQVPGWDDQYYSIPLLVLAAIWLVLVGWSRRQYTSTLANSLKRRVLDLEQVTIDIADETTVSLIANALRDPDELHVLHTLQLIAGAGSVNWDAHVAPLLAHASATVNLQALRHIGRPGNTAFLADVAPFLDTENSELRAAAIAAYCTMAGDAAAPRIRLFLDAADPKVKGAAVAGLIQLSGGVGEDARCAEAELQHMLESSDPAARLEGTRVIGMVQAPGLAARLIPHFADTSPDVRNGAIQSAGELGAPALVAYLISALENRASAAAAAQALAKYTSGIEPQLSAALDHPQIGGLVPRILERLGTPAAIKALLARFDTPDEHIRAEVHRALARLRSSGVAVDLPTSAVRAALFGEIRRSYTWVVLREDLAEKQADALLAEALDTRLRQTHDRIFVLLGLLDPQHTLQISRIRQALETESDTLRALAIEQLDNLTEHHVKEFLLPLIEAPAKQQLEIAQKQFTLERAGPAEQLRGLALGQDRWLRICAIAHTGSTRQVALLDAVRAALDSEDALLRETALIACGRLLDARQFAALASAHAADARFPIVQRYAQAQLSLLAPSTSDREPTALVTPLPQGDHMPLSTIERVLLLKGAGLFNHITSEELVPLALIAQEISFPSGTTLIRQGDLGDCLFIIVAGEASINIRSVGTVARRAARDCIGEMGLLSRQPRSADCVALTDITALRIERADFWEVLAEMPALARGVIDTLSQRLDEAVANLHNVRRNQGNQ